MKLESFFSNVVDFNTFCSLKAKGRIISNEKELKVYESEIEESSNECAKVFKENGSDVNFVTELLDLETKFQNLEKERYKSSELDALASRRDDLYEQYNSFVNNLPLKEKEKLEFNSKKVLDREQRINETKSLLNELERNFPEARNLDVEKTFANLPILVAIKEYLNPISEKELTEPEEDLRYVTKYTKSDSELIDEQQESIVDINEVEKVKIPTEPEVPEEINHDNSFFGDAFPGSLENGEDLSSLFTSPVEEIKVENINFPEEDITPFNLEEAPILETEQNEEDHIVSLFNEETDISKKEMEPIEEKTNSEYIIFPMNDKTSLTELAEAACHNKEGWYDIYNLNKDIIDERLSIEGKTIEEVKDKPGYLTGLDLAIPNVYTHLNKDNNLTTEENNITNVKESSEFKLAS